MDAASTRVFISREDRTGLVMGCDRCEARRRVDAESSVLDQLLTFLDEHGHAG